MDRQTDGVQRLMRSPREGRIVNRVRDASNVRPHAQGHVSWILVFILVVFLFQVFNFFFRLLIFSSINILVLFCSISLYYAVLLLF